MAGFTARFLSVTIVTMDGIPEGRNIKLVVAYDGTAYHGWQRQAGGLETIQGHLEAAAARVLAHRVAIGGAGRTDAGVHAAGQVANFHTPNAAVPLAPLRRAIDSRCPRAYLFLSAEEVGPEFHASRSAVGKTYRYRIYVGPAKPVMRARHVYAYPRALDAARMRAAGQRLLGAHDFLGFASSAEDRADTVREITACDLAERGDELHVSVTGTGFLYKMVRNIVGTLIEIGRGRWPVERIDRILCTRDRRDAGFTAPPGGLCLMSVAY